MMKTYRKSFSLFIFALLFLTLLNNLNAQPDGFVQSRFVGAQDITGCPNFDDCDAESDGALHFRLKQLGELGEEVFTDTDGDEAVRFEVQFRAAIQDISYNAGEVFITSTGPQAFRENLASDCKISDEGVFKDNSNYNVGSLQHVSPHLMKVSVTATTNVDPAEVIELGKDTDYQTYAILECKIADTDADAGLAFHAETYTANSIWVGSGGARTSKVVFVMADNDLRGFRLDGKTWAEDYLLSDDASVIVKFSKGIKTQLTEEHFTLLYTESNVIDTVESVVHSPGDDEVFISYMQSDDEAILSISTNTVVIFDNDDNPLAPGSFLARLNLVPPDPHISAITPHSETTNEYASRGLSRWCVLQNTRTGAPSFLRASVNKDNLCLADKFSYDCLEEDGQPFIHSVFADEYDADESPENICAQSGSQYYITVVIDPIAAQRKEGRSLELRFKRNAVLATDLQAFSERASLDSQIALADTIGPKITVRAMSRWVSAENIVAYTINFTVTADEPVNNLDSEASYQLLRVLKDGSTVAVAGVDGSIQNASAIDAYTVEVEARTFAPSDDEAEDTFGYTLGYVAVGGISDGTNGPINEAGEPLQDDDALDSSRQAIVRIGALECAAVYPHIGQKELFIEISGNVDVNEGGFVIDGQPAQQIEQVGDTTEDGLSVFKVTLDEIVSAPIAVEYHQTNETIGTTATATVLCRSSLTNDSDGDGTPDITDAAPFDADRTDVNTAVASANPLSPAPAESSDWYSRDTIIPALLKREEFTYVEVEAAKPVKKQFTSEDVITARDYFGITDSDARVFKGNTDATVACPIFATAVELNLTNVKVDEYCTDVTDSLGHEPPGSFVYSWAKVTANGLLASMHKNYNVTVLSEIKISGQSSYFYAEPPATPKNIIISAYAPDATNTPIELTVKGTVVSGDPIADARVVLERRGDTPGVFVGPKVYSAIHPVTGVGKNPQAGQTIRHWLTGSSNVWHATEATVMPTDGGHGSFGNVQYAIGANSYVDVRVAKDGTAEPITQIDYIALYDVTDSPGTMASTVTSVVQGRYYYLIAGLTTNSTETRVVPMEVDGYTTLTQVVEQAGTETIGFQVNSGDDVDDTITVGWDRIGTAENVLATYRVSETIPAGYNLPDPSDDLNNADDDGDRIRNEFDLSPDSSLSLPVAVNNNINPSIDWLGAVSWFDQPLYVTNEGLIIAASKGDNEFSDYSAANIDYRTLSADTKTQLAKDKSGFMDDASITSLVTFGIRSVNYGFSQENDEADAMVVGSVAYAVFPLSQASPPNQVFYISRYNDDDEAERWERFERGAHIDSPADTWYVIDRESNTYCPLDVGIYRNEHRTEGDEGMGFTANTQKCVLVAITDGGPYDNTGVDGIIDTLLAMGTELQPRSQEFAGAGGGGGGAGGGGAGGGGAGGGGAGGGGGGGAIGVGTLLLLFVLLLSLIMTTRNQSRLPRCKRQA